MNSQYVDDQVLMCLWNAIWAGLVVELFRISIFLTISESYIVYKIKRNLLNLAYNSLLRLLTFKKFPVFFREVELGYKFGPIWINIFRPRICFNFSNVLRPGVPVITGRGNYFVKHHVGTKRIIKDNRTVFLKKINMILTISSYFRF